MKEFLFGAGMALIGVMVGNHQGDQSTLRDCAIKGVAAMVGGGTIQCKVNSVGAKT